MSAPAARRDNGLVAPEYLRVARPLTDVAEPLLVALRRTRIAAFVVSGPTEGRVELWVDAREVDDVRTVLAAVQRHTERAATDIALVGNDDADDPPLPVLVEGWRSANPTPSVRPFPAPLRLGRPLPAPADDDAAGDVEEHFDPAEVDALPRLSGTARWALVILGLGTVALVASGLLASLAGPYDGLLSLLGTVGVLVGAGMLVTRLRDGRRDDGQGNDGGPNGDGAIL